MSLGLGFSNNKFVGPNSEILVFLYDQNPELIANCRGIVKLLIHLRFDLGLSVGLIRG